MIFDRSSASQHRAFLRCQRYWFFGWRMRLERPSTVGTRRGKKIHHGTEHYLLTGEVKDQPDPEGDYRAYVEALVPHLPPPMHDELLIEHRIWLRTDVVKHHRLGEADKPENRIGWLGYIDIGFDRGDRIKIDDIKSTSDWRYNKTPEELSEDIQLISYGRWVYEDVGYPGEVELGHLYIKTGKKVPKKPKVRPVSITVTKDHVDQVWGEAQETVAQMREVAASVTNVHDLPPTVSACGMYGGCPFKEQCGLTTRDVIASLGNNKNKEKGMNSFINRIKKAQKPEGTIPPDAAPRETSDEEAAKVRAAAEEKARKAEEKKAKEAAKKAEAAEAEERGRKPLSSMKKDELVAYAVDLSGRSEKEIRKMNMGPLRDYIRGLESGEIEVADQETKDDAAPKNGHGGDLDATVRIERLTLELESAMEEIARLKKGEGFVLYIDCAPAKDVLADGLAPTLFEDWYDGVQSRMNEIVAEAKDGLATYWGLGFAEQKALITETVAAACERGLPPAMIVSSGAIGAKDALSCLIPHADRVVRSTRG